MKKQILTFFFLLAAVFAFAQTKPTYTLKPHVMPKGNVIFVGNYDTANNVYKDSLLFVLQSTYPQIWAKNRFELFSKLGIRNSVYCYDSIGTGVGYYLSGETGLFPAMYTDGDYFLNLNAEGDEIKTVNKIKTTDSIRGSLGITIGNNTNGIKLDTTNGIKFLGTATVFDDLNMPFSTGKQGTADYPPFDVDSNYYTFTIDTTPAGVCIMYFQVQMPHNWATGTTIYPHLHFKQIGSGTPKFRVKYRWMNTNGTDKTWKYYNLTTATGTTTNTEQMLYGTSGISGSGKTLSSILLIQLYLYEVASGQSDCKAYMFDIHYEIDGLGSSKQTEKY